MTAFTPSEGQRVKIRQKLTTTSDVALYTGRVKTRSFLSSIQFCNIGSTEGVYLWVNDGTSDYFILNNDSIPGNDYLHFTGLEIDIREGDTLYAKLNTTGNIDVIGTVIEQYPSDQVSIAQATA